jgi:hypothetical protein
MKNKWELVCNPFTKIAGWKAFAVGAVIVCATVVVGYWNDAYFTAIQMKAGRNLTPALCFAIQTVGLLSMVILMYPAALFLAKQVRFQDILGTVTLARYPYLFLALLMFYFNPKIMPVTERLLETAASGGKISNALLPVADYLLLLLFALFAMLFIVWYIALLYNAFKVSTGIKGYKTAILLTAIILVSETVTFIIIAHLSIF